MRTVWNFLAGKGGVLCVAIIVRSNMLMSLHARGKLGNLINR